MTSLNIEATSQPGVGKIMNKVKSVGGKDCSAVSEGGTVLGLSGEKC